MVSKESFQQQREEHLLQTQELKQQLNEIQQALDNFRVLYDSAPMGYFTLDEKLFILDVNHSGCELLGLPKQRLLGKIFYHFISRESRFSFFLNARKALKNQTRQNCEIRMQKEDGSSFFVQMEDIAVSLSGGDSRRHLVAVIDITQRKTLEEALESALTETESSKSSLETILRSLPLGILIMENPRGLITYANAQSLRILGFDPKGTDLPALTAAEIKWLGNDGSECSQEELPFVRALTRGEDVHNQELTLIQSDGSAKLLSISTASIFSKDGQPYSAIIMLDEITPTTK